MRRYIGYPFVEDTNLGPLRRRLTFRRLPLSEASDRFSVPPDGFAELAVHDDFLVREFCNRYSLAIGMRALAPSYQRQSRKGRQQQACRPGKADSHFTPPPKVSNSLSAPLQSEPCALDHSSLEALEPRTAMALAFCFIRVNCSAA